MPLIEWTNDLSVGVHVIDSDHKLLISLINQLDDAIHDGTEGPATVGSVLNALLEYTEYHFSREEMILEAVGYAGLGRHHEGHRRLAAKVADIRDRYLEDPNAVPPETILDFMRAWLTDHIKTSDKAYQPYMEGKADLIDEANKRFSAEQLRAAADDEMELGFL